MNVTWQNKHIVFDINDGPKTMTDSLNLEGNDGWEVSSIVSVAGSKLCVFLKKGTYINELSAEDEKHEEISKLWGGK
jgi:tyrosine-protein phosphatase YwqE|tara:strand:- start:1063 stop:1293 length:231 start_codon:yes stop_codon:yes gene_type:complete